MPLCDKVDTCFSIDSVTTHEKDIVDNLYSYLPLVTSKADSSFFLKNEAHDHQPAPKFKAVDLKIRVKNYLLSASNTLLGFIYFDKNHFL